MAFQRDPALPPWSWNLILVVLAATLCPAVAPAQEPSRYLAGEQRLEMVVHIMGEVQKPGEYRVSDETDLVQLLSKAGGPTAYSKLSQTTVRRVVLRSPAAGGSRIEIIPVDLAVALRDPNASSAIPLQPGDVAMVPRNSWYTWRNVSIVVRDLAVVASAYFLYLRSQKP